VSPRTSPAGRKASPPAPVAAAAPTAQREQRQIVILVGAALGVGALLQLFIAPGPIALVASALVAGVAVFVMSQLMPGRWRETMAGFRFTSVLLVALAIAAILGTLVLQNKDVSYYAEEYGTVGALIVALRLDDIFHSIWFGNLIALFGAAVVNSALLRFPVGRRNTGFFLCHLGLITSLLGCAVSAALTVKGRIDLHAGGEHATSVKVTKNGVQTGETEPLGFDLRLDRFDLVRYEPEHRVAFYEATEVRYADGGRGWEYKLKASFDPVEGERHLLPGGNAFRILKLHPEYGAAGTEMRNPAAVLEVRVDGETRETPLLFAHQPGRNFVQVGRDALVFEKRDTDVKAFISHVTATRGAETARARIAVNEPLSFGGWTLYQVNYNPDDPTYSGIDAVRDPGVRWVFLGFFLISLGVAWMFYVDQRRPKKAGVPADAAGSSAKAA
jgi:hypothetical protein